MSDYIHGYTERETLRLYEQSVILEPLLHHDIYFQPGSFVLEAGCGVGAQTVLLAKKNPDVSFISVDISKESLLKAKEKIKKEGIKKVDFQLGNLASLPYEDNSFDSIFVCFVLEHIHQPNLILHELKRVLKKGGTIYIIEGDHGSCFWHPETSESIKCWQSMIKIQQSLGHDPLIGRKLYSLLSKAEYTIQLIIPKWVYTDSLNSKQKQDILSKIIVPMAETAKEKAIEMGIIDLKTWEKGINDIKEISINPTSSFFYSWFKARAIKL